LCLAHAEVNALQTSLRSVLALVPVRLGDLVIELAFREALRLGHNYIGHRARTARLGIDKTRAEQNVVAALAEITGQG
jgi:hypothetical protein